MIDYPATWSQERIDAHQAYLRSIEELDRVKNEVLQPAMDAFNEAEREMNRRHEEFLDIH